LRHAAWTMLGELHARHAAVWRFLRVFVWREGED